MNSSRTRFSSTCFSKDDINSELLVLCVLTFSSRFSSLQSKRCVSMPSVTSSSASSTVSSRSRLVRLQDRRFHQKFPGVESGEHIVNYFSCALLGDILLQGHLFITENYFAFYSNIFGHKTQLLIRITDVVKITKEKTAKFIPNAVGVHTEKDKYIFGSLLSRDTAYRVIHQTWMKCVDAGLEIPEDSESETSPVLVLLCTDEDSMSGVSGHLTSDEVSVEETSEAPPPTDVTSDPPPTIPFRSHCHNETKSRWLCGTGRCSLNAAKDCISKVEEIIFHFSKLSRTSLLIMLSTALLVLLFLSASVLLYRISVIHKKLGAPELWSDLPRLGLVNEAHDKEVELSRLVNSLQERIRHLSQIRQMLEELFLTASKLHGACTLPLNIPVAANVPQDSPVAYPAT